MFNSSPEAQNQGQTQFNWSKSNKSFKLWQNFCVLNYNSCVWQPCTWKAAESCRQLTACCTMKIHTPSVQNCKQSLVVWFRSLTLQNVHSKGFPLSPVFRTDDCHCLDK